MPGGRPLSATTVAKQVRSNTRAVKAEQRNPVFPGKWIYVGDPLNTGFTTTPDWQNDFFYVDPYYIGFRHGLDGQLDMIGMYDLTLGAVSGDVAFTLPAQYRQEAPPVSMFPIELAVGVWSIAIQAIDNSSGDVTIYWPIVADPVP